jgi:hypothetical protein
MEVQMSMIVMWFKKAFLMVWVAALGFGTLPMINASALGPSDSTTPTPPTQSPTDRLESVWIKEQAIYTKLGSFLNNSDPFLTRAQGFINKAKANGKDTSALQAALDAFANALKQAEPIYQSAGEIISSHKGFDENGKVINQVQALATVKDLRNNFIEIHQLLLGPRQALKDAFKAFREANKSSTTPTPTQSSG